MSAEPEHDTSGDGTSCWCKPTVEDIPAADGTPAGRLVIHNSADGREHREPDHDRDSCPTCRGEMLDAARPHPLKPRQTQVTQTT